MNKLTQVLILLVFCLSLCITSKATPPNEEVTQENNHNTQTEVALLSTEKAAERTANQIKELQASLKPEKTGDPFLDGVLDEVLDMVWGTTQKVVDIISHPLSKDQQVSK